ncbi:ATP-binding cassette domain-containing protein [Metabacillus indicus]|uniref:ATP-binding cassette domain-containing protein n=1 Tax=Metabacillus indicus TaxID=246786 RepID=UPI0024915227|nr:ATP-binding cassette domain-containing protein [Metabacillus indicus]
MHNSYLRVEGVEKRFKQHTALKNVSFDIRKNEFVCLLGPSGCGKTTLLRIIAGLEEPDAGRIFAGGKDITALPPAKRNFGIVFQSYALFPNLTALQNIEFGLRARKYEKKRIKEKAMEALALVELLHVKDKYPAQLSGGMQQRVSLARAIALEPDFLLLDEPLSALDAKVREKLRNEIRSVQEKLGITTIMVTHDQEEALTMADRIFVMDQAEIKQAGTPQEIYHKPNQPFVADFIGSMNFLNESMETAIRPEHVVVEEGKGTAAVIEAIEFKGPVYRVKVRMTEAASKFYNQQIIIDLSAYAAKEINLERGNVISISLPESRLLDFKEQVVS